jgi:hypothetical protein
MAFLRADRFSVRRTAGNEQPLARFYLNNVPTGKRKGRPIRPWQPPFGRHGIFRQLSIRDHRVPTLSLT